LSNHRIFYAAIGCLALGIIVVQMEAYNFFLTLNSPVASRGSGVNMLVNYGNGTIAWYNETSIPSVSNLYDLTIYLTKGNIEGKFYGPPYNEHFVTAINGVANNSPYYWTVWLFCRNKNGWTVALVGADEVRIAKGETVAWAYEIPYHAPLPGALTVDSCS
jgi:hypothetical protein